MMHHFEPHRAILIGVIVLLFGGAFVWLARRESMQSRAKRIPPGERAVFIARHLAFYDRAVRVGAARAVAESVLPEPNNGDREHVWVWVRDYKSDVGITDWRKLIAWPKNGYFLVLIDGKVVTPLCVASEFNPWDALARYAGMAQVQVDELLGPKPGL
jgi:hypothetical protein